MSVNEADRADIPPADSAVAATVTTIDQPSGLAMFEPAISARGRGSQATMIEQSRAVAEVQAAVVIARHNPRDKPNAIIEMREACGITGLAERAFFRFPRGGQQISGASIHLARELARCWGNIDHGIKELARDDAAGHSEMLAFAWDLQTNTRSETTFIVPHKRDQRGGAVMLTDMRDIYENNSNMGARRLRECIFSVLPVWFTEEAKYQCRKTLENGGGLPLATRLATMVDRFSNIGVSREQLASKIGRPVDQFTAPDLATLGVVFTSIQNGEATIADEFQRETAGRPRDGGDAFEDGSAGKSASKKPDASVVKGALNLRHLDGTVEPIESAAAYEKAMVGLMAKTKAPDRAEVWKINDETIGQILAAGFKDIHKKLLNMRATFVAPPSDA